MFIPKLKGKASLKIPGLVILSLLTLPISVVSISAMTELLGFTDLENNILIKKLDELLLKISELGIIEKISEITKRTIDADTFVAIIFIIGLVCYYISDGAKSGFKISKTMVLAVHHRLQPFMTNPFADTKYGLSFIFTGLLFTIDLFVLILGVYLFLALAFPLTLLNAAKKITFDINLEANTEDISPTKEKLLEWWSKIMNFLG